MGDDLLEYTVKNISEYSPIWTIYGQEYLCLFKPFSRLKTNIWRRLFGQDFQRDTLINIPQRPLRGLGGILNIPSRRIKRVPW